MKLFSVDEMISEVDIDGDGRIDFEGKIKIIFSTKWNSFKLNPLAPFCTHMTPLNKHQQSNKGSNFKLRKFRKKIMMIVFCRIFFL